MESTNPYSFSEADEEEKLDDWDTEEQIKIAREKVVKDASLRDEIHRKKNEDKYKQKAEKLKIPKRFHHHFEPVPIIEEVDEDHYEDPKEPLIKNEIEPEDKKEPKEPLIENGIEPEDKKEPVEIKNEADNNLLNYIDYLQEQDPSLAILKRLKTLVNKNKQPLNANRKNYKKPIRAYKNNIKKLLEGKEIVSEEIEMRNGRKVKKLRVKNK